MPEHHDHHEGHRMATVIKGIIIALAIVLVVLLIFLVSQSIKIRREKIVSARELLITNLFKRHGPPTAADVTIVRPWMTFDYVNTLFRVPPNYLQTQLMISDPHYPKITIGGYANGQKLNQAVFLENVETALMHYLATATSTAATSTAATTTKL